MTGDNPGNVPGSGLAELAGQLLADIDDLSADIAAQISERVPFYAADSIAPPADLLASARANAESCSTPSEMTATLTSARPRTPAAAGRCRECRCHR